MTQSYFLSDSFWLHLELFGVITGLIFLYLEIKQRPSMWLVGGLSSLVYIVVFCFAKIYADMSYNIYNFIISIYGFFLWIKYFNNAPKELKEKKFQEIEYRHISRNEILLFSGLSIFLYFVIYYILSYFTDSPIPADDSFTTTLSIVATLLLVKKIIQHWLMWIVINIASVFIYYERGLYPTSALYVVYGIAAVYGFYIWRKEGKDFSLSVS